MTITQLYYVLAVAENKNFTLAAEKCFVTQPTLSMQIQKLEDELGIQIFDSATLLHVAHGIVRALPPRQRRRVAQRYERRRS